MKENNNKIHQESLFTEEECPTVDTSINKKPRKEEHRIQCYITNKKSLERINKLSEAFSVPRNNLLNQLIEIALPILEKRYNVFSSTEEQNLLNQKDELIQAQQKTIENLLHQISIYESKTEKYFLAIRDELTHINATTSIQEYINSSTYEHLKFLLNIFIATQGAGKMSEELSRSYDNRIAEQFLEKKIDALSNFKKTNKVQFVKTKEGDEK